MKHFISLIMLSLFALAAQAGQWGLQIHTVSHHFNSRDFGTWNENNYGIAVRYVHDQDVSVQFGRYLNSYSIYDYKAYTNYVAVDYTPWHFKTIDFGGYIGAGSGYDTPWFRRDGDKMVLDHIEERPLVFSGGILARWNFGNFNITGRVNPGMAELEYGVVFK